MIFLFNIPIRSHIHKLTIRNRIACNENICTDTGYVHIERASLSVSLDARRDANQNQPVVCNTAVVTGRMAPDSTPSAKICQAPSNEQCWLFAWRDRSCLLPGKDISSVQCINGRKYGILNTAAT
jgi:hypothetical protein